MDRLRRKGERKKKKRERGEGGRAAGEKSDAIDTLELQKEERKVHSIFFFFSLPSPLLKVLSEDIRYVDSAASTPST